MHNFIHLVWYAICRKHLNTLLWWCLNLLSCSVIACMNDNYFWLIVYTAQLLPARKGRCGHCIACTEPDCGVCSSCKDMKKFGGPGRKKKACIKRKCLGGKQNSTEKVQQIYINMVPCDFKNISIELTEAVRCTWISREPRKNNQDFTGRWQLSFQIVVIPTNGVRREPLWSSRYVNPVSKFESNQLPTIFDLRQ